MKVLVSAYACNPYLGSEPGVGWSALCRIARQHDVWVLVHSRHQTDWEKAREAGKIPQNIEVRFLGAAHPWHPNRFLAHLQSWRSFRAYNDEVLEAARKWHDEVGFDLCHQVTIATWRIPSPLWKLPIPLVWGPIGGAGYIPAGFRRMLSKQARLFEKVRDLNSWWAIRSNAFRQCVDACSTIFAANEETAQLLAPFRGEKPLVILPIASISDEKAARFAPSREENLRDSGPLLLFAGGNMEGRKGVSLALRALAKARTQGLDFRYTVAGGGPEVPGLKRLADELGLSDWVEFHPGYSGDGFVRALQETHVYFLPSFRESTPVTLLEAYLAACYPLVADTGAQGEIVGKIGGSAVGCVSMNALVDGLAAELLNLSARRDELREEVASWWPKLRQVFDAARYDQAIEEAYSLAVTEDGTGGSDQ